MTNTESNAGEAPPGGGPDRMTHDQEVGHYIDIWKQTVEMQMHFNDIEWRIRGLALTVATFALGAAAVAAKDGTHLGPVSLGTVALLVGLMLWYAFYFVDRIWYHPLLKAAVRGGTEIEKEIRQSLPHAKVTETVTAGSEYQVEGIARLTGKQVMHSDDKLRWFYTVGAVALGLAALLLQAGLLWNQHATSGSTTPSAGSTTTSAPTGG